MQGFEEKRAFSQALVLVKQEKGYYVMTDTVHVHSRGVQDKVLPLQIQDSTATKSKGTGEDLAPSWEKVIPKF